jgi:hypothetical protein
MTNLNDNPTPVRSPEQPNFVQRLLSKLRRSPKQIGWGVAILTAAGALGYAGVNYLVKQKLPPFLETQIANIIDRPINLGEVEGFSLTGIKLGKSTIPATATDPDRINLDGIEVGFNLLPVIFRRTLPLQITLHQLDVYIEQTADGQWVNLDFLETDKDKETKSPVNLDITANLDRANITALPYEKPEINIKVDGSGRYSDASSQKLVAYDLDTSIQKATANVVGETILDTGKTDTKLIVKDLAWSDITTLLPNFPVKLDRGVFNADLDVDIPSFAEITSADVRGNVSLQDVVGEAELPSKKAGERKKEAASVKARSNLNFGGRNAQISNSQASLGNIVARLGGKVDLNTGYDLDVEVLPLQLGNLPQGIKSQIPLDIGGEVTAQLEVSGAIKEPLIKGKINNTETVRVDRTKFKTIDANFSADLQQVVLQDLTISPLAGGEITASGVVETKIKQSLDEGKEIDPQQMPLSFNFNSQLPVAKIAQPYYQFPQDVTVGNLDARGAVKGTIGKPEALVNWKIPQANAKGVENIAGGGAILFAENILSLRDTQLKIGDEGKVDIGGNANLNNKQWQAKLNTNSVYVTPFLASLPVSGVNLDRPITLDNAKVKLNGSIDNFDLDRIKGIADLNLNVDGGDVAVNSRLDKGNIQASANTNTINLNRFLDNLPASATINSSTITAQGKLKQLLAFADNPDLNSFTAKLDAALTVADGTVNAIAGLSDGNINAKANTSSINLAKFVADLPVPATINSSQVEATGKLKQLFTFAKNPNLDTFTAKVNADLAVAEGTVRAIAGLNNNQWQADIDGNNISSRLLLNQFAPSNLSTLDVEDIAAQSRLTGSIEPLINNTPQVPIKVDRVALQSGTQNIRATGDVTLADLTSNFDVARTNLGVQANIDFDRLPIDQILSQNDLLLAENVNLRGNTTFNGIFQGKNLISAPTAPGNIALTGNVGLQDFAFNEAVFEPELTGRLEVRPETAINLNLRGDRDVIAAAAIPCTASNCRLPYLPTVVEVRQGENTNKPIIATGKKEGEIFDLDIQNFPLAVLNFAPGKTAGIQGALAGKTTGEIQANLYTFAAEGNVTVAKPAVGYIAADKFAADFAYNPKANTAEVTTASLDLRDSQYNITDAGINLNSGEIKGKLSITQAYIQDILTTLRWYTVEDVANLFQIPRYGRAKAVRPNPEQKTIRESIATKLNLLRKVEAKIQQVAAANKTGNVPTELNIEGGYSGEVVVAGTIDRPEASFYLDGNSWQWQPQRDFPNIVPPLGLIKEAKQYISIPSLGIKGKLENNVVNLETAKLQVEDATLSLNGELSPETQDAEFQVKNLTVDTIASFVTLPVDIAGTINTTGTIAGTLEQPKLDGEIIFTEGAFNGTVLPTTIAGKYGYNGKQLAFNTTQPSSIQVAATVPYPIQPEVSDTVTANAKLDTEAFSLLGAFTQNNLTWLGGEGNADLQATARLDLNRTDVLYALKATGEVNLAEAKIASAFVEEPLTATGKATLNNQIVNVENLQGNIGKKDLSVSGKLPILKPVNNLDNPLTVTIPQEGGIELNNLYEGGVAGNVIVTGAALSPVIGGEVSLKDGIVSIPQNDEAAQETYASVSSDPANPVATRRDTAPDSGIVTRLNNFQVNLDNFDLEQALVYEFTIDGKLTLNGIASDLTQIEPKGKLYLNQADINLFSNNFSVVRNRDNIITFKPEAGVFNPYVDVRVQTELSQLENVGQLDRDRDENELPDPISQTGRSDITTITLAIDGNAEEIIPTLGNPPADFCNIRPSDAPLSETGKYYTQKELNSLTTCFNTAAIETASDRQILDSPAVQLTSIPSRSQGEIVSLLGNQFISFAEQLQNSNESELVDLGLTQFVVAPLQRRIFYRVEDEVVGFGKKIGLDYLRVYPYLEGIYELDRDSSVRSTYDYIFNEVKIEYQRRF